MKKMILIFGVLVFASGSSEARGVRLICKWTDCRICKDSIVTVDFDKSVVTEADEFSGRYSFRATITPIYIEWVNVAGTKISINRYDGKLTWDRHEGVLRHGSCVEAGKRIGDE
jgi:hypothetical protein